MKANEFRVGNLLVKDGSIVVVDAETILKFQCQLKECERYQPIPISEEWLLKFGYQKDKDRESLYIDIEDGFSKWDLMFYKDCVYLKSRYQQENLDIQHFSKINYVHQLQNLYFALTGQEL